MRPGSRVLLAIGLAGLFLIASEESFLASSLFDVDMNGCSAVNSGALDLDVKIDARGSRAGQMGSGLVGGFREGEVLTFVREGKAGSTPMLHRATIAALQRGGENRIQTVFDLEEQIVPVGRRLSQFAGRYVIPSSGTSWSLFTSSRGEGEGQYKLTVKCDSAAVSYGKTVRLAASAVAHR